MMRSVVLAITDRAITRKFVTDTSGGRAVARRFVAGDTLGDALAVTKELNAAGMAVSLDHLGEHVTSVDEATAARDSYLACLHQIAREGLDANISVKLTQLGLGLEMDPANETVTRYLDDIAAAARVANTTVTIDMEESTHTQATIEIYAVAQAEHGNLGVAIQSYLRRTREDLDTLLPLGGHIRLCKGAYAEPEDVVFQSSDEVNAAFDRLGELLMASPNVKPAIASHDPARQAHMIEAAQDRAKPWEFQVLYGAQRDRQAELVALGHEVRVYVPYGEAWYPYLTRRLAERPANLWFFLRALLRG